MNSECFLHVICHFTKHSAISTEYPFLLIKDSHKSHLFIQPNGITIVTIPPHCIHNLHPLDGSLKKPFHTFNDFTGNSRIISHTGDAGLIYNVASCIGIAYPRAMTRVNIETKF